MTTRIEDATLSPEIEKAFQELFLLYQEIGCPNCNNTEPIEGRISRNALKFRCNACEDHDDIGAAIIFTIRKRINQ